MQHSRVEEFAGRIGNDRANVTKTGMLLKLPRGPTKTNWRFGSSPWQPRDFVLDTNMGTLSYYAKGQAGFAKHLKGVLRLRGGQAAAVSQLHGEPFAFELQECLYEDDKVGELRLAASTVAEMDSWLVALRFAMKRHAGKGDDDSERPSTSMAAPEVDDFVDAGTVLKTQKDTSAAVGRIQAMLADSESVAATTAETMDAQAEQLDTINGDLAGLNANIKKADKNFDK